MNNKIEKFILEYFTFSSILGSYFDKKIIYSLLKDVFVINDDLFDLLNNENVNEINSLEDYKRYLRIKQYVELTNVTFNISDEVDTIISLKGKAIKETCEFKLYSSNDCPQSLIENNLIETAKCGNITAMRILGFLKFHGIFFSKDQENGLKYITKASLWGDINSCLMAILYDENNRIKHFKELKSANKDTSNDLIVNELMQKYNITDCKISEEILLIKKAISNGKTKDDNYNPFLARLVFSDILSIKDKEKIILSDNKNLLSEVCNLPLKLKYNEFVYDENKFNELSIKRDNELKHILSNLKTISFRNTDIYKPLCLFSSGEKVLEEYINIITKSFSNVNIDRINVSELGEKDLVGTKNNIFFRSIKEDKNNILVLEFKGNITENVINEAISFLKFEKKNKFYLYDYDISLDLSSILPICICDKENIHKLKAYTDYVEIVEYKDFEKPNFIKYIINNLCDNLRVNININDDAISRLSSLSIKNINKVLNYCVKYQNNSNVNITKEMIQEYINDNIFENKNGFGFGGKINENN